MGTIPSPPPHIHSAHSSADNVLTMLLCSRPPCFWCWRQKLLLRPTIIVIIMYREQQHHQQQQQSPAIYSRLTKFPEQAIRPHSRRNHPPPHETTEHKHNYAVINCCKFFPITYSRNKLIKSIKWSPTTEDYIQAQRTSMLMVCGLPGYRTRAEPQLTSKAITIPDNDTPNCYSRRYTTLQSSSSSSIQSIIVLVVTRVIIAMPVNWTISQAKFIN